MFMRGHLATEKMTEQILGDMCLESPTRKNSPFSLEHIHEAVSDCTMQTEVYRTVPTHHLLR
jgi:hypothetical protein